MFSKVRNCTNTKHTVHNKGSWCTFMRLNIVPQMTNLQRMTRQITVNTTYVVATGCTGQPDWPDRDYFTLLWLRLNYRFIDTFSKSPCHDQSTGWITGVWLLAGAEIFLFSTASKPAIGISQSAIHCIPQDLSLMGEWLRKPHNAF